MQLVVTVLIFLVFLAVAVWIVVWINRRLSIPPIGSGMSASIFAVSIRVFVSCIAIVAVTMPLLAALEVLSAILD